MRMYNILLILTALMLIGCDHATKHWAQSHLARSPSVEIFPDVLELRYTENRDIGFSLLRFIPADVRRPIIIGTQSLVTIAITVFGVRTLRRRSGGDGGRTSNDSPSPVSPAPEPVRRRRRSVFRLARPLWIQLLGFALLLAGALGNLIDRIFRGYVVDFIYLHYWPVFNVADGCIVAGSLLVLGAGYLRGMEQVPPARA